MAPAATGRCRCHGLKQNCHTRCPLIPVASGVASGTGSAWATGTGGTWVLTAPSPSEEDPCWSHLGTVQVGRLVTSMGGQTKVCSPSTSPWRAPLSALVPPWDPTWGDPAHHCVVLEAAGWSDRRGWSACCAGVFVLQNRAFCGNPMLPEMPSPASVGLAVFLTSPS